MTLFTKSICWPSSIKMFVLVFFLFMGSFMAFAQSAYEGEGEDRINMAWAYYGRGNGLSVLYDHGFSDLISAGAGVEFYFEDSERETSFFGLVDLHLKEVLGLPERLDLYPGAEIGSFAGSFDIYPYLGFSFAISEKFGLFTEIGERGTAGVYFNF